MDKLMRHHPIGTANNYSGAGEDNLTLAIHQTFECAQLFAKKSMEKEVAQKLGISNEPAKAVKTESFTAMPIAPGQWILITPKYDGEFVNQIEREVEGIGYVSDQTDSRAGVRISGNKVFGLLERLCRLDLRKAETGFCANTPIGAINALIHQPDEGVFDIYVYAGFGQSLWETITHTASQFGYKVEDFVSSS